MDIRAEILRLIPDPKRVSVSESLKDLHAQDLSYHRPHQPDVVVYPQNVEEISAVLRFANEHRIPVIPFGCGSSIEGHVIPIHGGISMNMSLMNRILEIRPNDFMVKVQPGVTRLQLNKALQAHGLFFPVDPGADASIGGMVATNASGTSAVRYGAMRNQVLQLQVVAADGTIFRTGSATVKSSAGYNLTGLFVGSEGTLGVISEITLRVYGIPEQIVAARAIFHDVHEACQAAYEIIGAGIPIGRVELVDERTLQAVNQHSGTAYPEKPTLFLEFSGTQNSVQADTELAQEICQAVGGTDFTFVTDNKERAELWKARHDVALAIMETAPGKRMKTTDVCVPISEMPEAIRQARITIDRHGIYGAILGHVGDGNYHVCFMVDPENQEEVRIAEEVNREIVEYALAHDGTCTGEHGVGLGKMEYLKAEHPSSLPIMKAIKDVLDPHHILNPGKIFEL